VPAISNAHCQIGRLKLKAIASLFLLAGLLFSGCGKDETASARQTNATSSGNPLTAPVDYLGAAAKAQKSATKTVAGTGIDQAIKLYYTQEGKFPADLNQLVPEYLPNLPALPAGMKYNYDPKTGVVKIEPK
jgi:hypothetical protein